MKSWSKLLFTAWLYCCAVILARAQQPVVGATITVPTNEGSGAYTAAVSLTAAAVGATPFTYNFKVNGNSVGTTNPTVWTPPAPGVYFVTVDVTDNAGNKATSLPARYFATGVVINSPSPGTLVPQGSTVVLKSDATTSAGTFIDKVEFLDGGTVIGTDTTAPYSFIYTVPGAAGSTHAITARATDNTGATSTSPVANTLTVVAPILPLPTTAISSPVDDATITIPTGTATIPISVDANSSTGRISKVEIYKDGELFTTKTTFPYTVSTWQPTVVGTYVLVALAYDDKNNVIASSAATIHIVPPPTVTVITPSAGSTVIGGSPTPLVATASDSGGSTITSVQFFVDSVFVAQATTPNMGTSNYQVTATLTQKIDPDTGLAIPSIVTALATNSIGSSGISPGVSVNVTNGGSGGSVTIGNPPTVAVTTPTASTQVPVNRPVFLAATAADTDGNIVSVQFFVNNQSVGTTMTYPYTGTWTPTALGTYAITAKATDSDGNNVTSAAVTVAVVDPAPNLPTVAITDPADASSILVGTAQVLRATATDAVGVTSVQFFLNGQPQGSALTAFPFNTPWTPTVPGTYVITARATNVGGNQSTSAPVTVTVSGGTPPTVAITTPSSGATVPVNQATTIAATAISPTASIVNVQFFVNGTSIGTDTSFPYSQAWTPSSPGTYALRARATDSVGNFTDSTINVTVAGGAAPIVTMTNPATGGTYSVGTVINLTANATDPDGTVTSVQFFVNGVAQGPADTGAPYSTQWTPAASGTYVITAQATDNTGNVRTSTGTVVAITNNGAPTVSISSPSAGAAVSAGTTVNLTANATDNDGTIAAVRYFVNGNVVGTPATVAPFLTPWTPTATGSYTIVAEATDNSGNVTNSAARTVTVITNQPPTVSLSSPPAGSSSSANVPVTLTAIASDSDGSITSVRFLVNGNVVGAPVTASPYTATWTPTAIGAYVIVAEATDNSGNISTSASRTINVIANLAPVATITTPANGLTTTAGLSVGLSATATDADGSVAKIRFLVNGTQVGATQTAAPFTATWTPTSAGSYQILVEATDNVGNIANSPAVNVTVLANSLPVIALTSPANGAIVRVGSSNTLSANATDPDGTVASVQFLVNGVASGSAVTAFPYKTTWTPNAEGIYRITAIATDNAGGSRTASEIVVKVVSANTATDTFDTGIIVGLGENGRYAAADLGDNSLVFIGTSTTNGVTKTYYFTGLTIGASGEFSGSAGGHTITGTFSETGSFGTLDGNVSFSGVITFPGSVTGVTPGLYTGNITGRMTSLVTAVIGPDGAIAVYISDGTFQTAGFGAVDSTGGFSVLTNSGARFTGKADPATGFLTGTLTGGPGGTVMAATSAGTSFSDGSLRNLSTRGQVGIGNNVLIAGFVVGGTTPKQVLIRAVGPTLGRAPINFPGVLADPQLQVYDAQGNPILGLSNNNWAGNAGIVAASNAVGAFPLPSDSLDAVLLTTLQPGNYSVQVTGVNGGQGVALVEIWDVDNPTPFSSQKVLNISTRANVGTGNNGLIAGFMISGNTSKKVLIRGVGPSLGVVAPNLSVLADPVLRLQRLVNGTWVDVRENDNWEMGNDATLVRDAGNKVGAFPLVAGSKDAVILLNLPAGTYSASVSGAGNTTGIAIVEVYEIP